MQQVPACLMLQHCNAKVLFCFEPACRNCDTGTFPTAVYALLWSYPPPFCSLWVLSVGFVYYYQKVIWSFQLTFFQAFNSSSCAVIACEFLGRE